MEARVSITPALTMGDPMKVPSHSSTHKCYNDHSFYADVSNHTFYSLFNDRASKNPRATALVGTDGRLTYEMLSRRVDQVASRLVKLGICPEDRVGLLMNRTSDAVAVILGVMKIGAAFVPLDPAAPAPRLTCLLSEAGVKLLVTQQGVTSNFPEGLAKLYVQDITDEPGVTWPNEPTPGGLAYVMFTSGSTGKPKGVCIEHKSIVNLILAMYESIYVRYVDRFPLRASLVAPLFFDGLLERLGLLLHGHELHIIPDSVRRDPVALVEYCVCQRLDLLDFTPSHLKLLFDCGLFSSPGYSPIAVNVGGEAISPTFWEQLVATDRTDFYNVYGPTECTVNATSCRIADHPVRPSIGTPLKNYNVYILDTDYCPTPVGVPGEIWIGGIGLARGYINQPELTVERFAEIAVGTLPNQRLYRTGDLGRWLPDGSIEYRGRVDDQVKIRGFRVEPGEVEAALLRHPAVREAAVAARDDGAGGKQLVAYVIPVHGTSPDRAALRRHLGTLLPDYMVPAAFVMLEALPLSPNGKLDRKALPAPHWSHLGSNPSATIPRDPTEKALAEIWQRVLNVEQVSINDNFFELGGHSLLVIRLVRQIRKDLGVALPLTAVFQTKTLEQMATVVRREISRGSAGLPSSRNRVPDKPFFCLNWGPTLARYLEGHSVHDLGAGRFEDEAWLQGCRIEDMAHRFIDEMRAMQGEGPYFLGGFCMSAIVAFEMAQQLVAMGDRVPLLVFFDPPPWFWFPRACPDIGRRTLTVPGKAVTYLRRWAKGDSTAGITELVQKVKTYVIRLMNNMTLQAIGVVRGRVDHASILRRAIEQYQPRIYPGSIKQIVPTVRPLNPDWDPYSGAWSTLAGGGLEICEVPGDHTTMFSEPHVQVLAANLAAYLEQAKGKSRS
jgi:amino acid adenylation domain-containing protein